MIEIRPLSIDDDVSGFRSGNPDLDRFLLRFAVANQEDIHVGTTYLAVDGGRILGFATVALASCARADLPARRRRALPRYPLPALRLARLGVDERHRGRGVGAQLLFSVCQLARRLAGVAGCIGLLVDAKQGAVEFYERFGFERMTAMQGELLDRPRAVPMFLPLGSIPYR